MKSLKGKSFQLAIHPSIFYNPRFDTSKLSPKLILYLAHRIILAEHSSFRPVFLSFGSFVLLCDIYLILEYVCTINNYRCYFCQFRQIIKIRYCNGIIIRNCNKRKRKLEFPFLEISYTDMHWNQNYIYIQLIILDALFFVSLSRQFK